MRISFIELYNFPFRTTDRHFLFHVETHSEIIIEMCNSGGGEYSEMITTPMYFLYRSLSSMGPNIFNFTKKEYIAFKQYQYIHFATHIL